jgi:hypothetical protein
MRVRGQEGGVRVLGDGGGKGAVGEGGVYHGEAAGRGGEQRGRAPAGGMWRARMTERGHSEVLYGRRGSQQKKRKRNWWPVRWGGQWGAMKQNLFAPAAIGVLKLDWA